MTASSTWTALRNPAFRKPWIATTNLEEGAASHDLSIPVEPKEVTPIALTRQLLAVCMKRIEPEQNQPMLPILCKGSQQQRKRLSLFACHLSQLSLRIVPPPAWSRPCYRRSMAMPTVRPIFKLRLTKRALSPFLSFGESHSGHPTDPFSALAIS
jgi:hypothetical protein